MKNEIYPGPSTNRRFALCPNTVLAGDAVLVGIEPAIALNDYSAATGGTVFVFSGSFTLTVIGATVVSPQTPAALKPGAKVYVTGSLDSTTNVTTTLVISGATGGTEFGVIDPSYTGGVSSGATDTSAIVRLKGSE